MVANVAGIFDARLKSMSHPVNTSEGQPANIQAGDASRKRGWGFFSWNLVNSIVALAALVLSGLVYYNEYRVSEDLSVSLYDYLAYKSENLGVVSFRISVANIGNRPTVLAESRLIIATDKDFSNFRSVQWRGLGVHTTDDVLEGELEFIEPIHLQPNEIVTKNIHFSFEIDDSIQDADGRISMTVCFVVLNHAGNRVANHYGNYAAYPTGPLTMEMEADPQFRFQLLPEPDVLEETGIRCTRT